MLSQSRKRHEIYRSAQYIEIVQCRFLIFFGYKLDILISYTTMFSTKGYTIQSRVEIVVLLVSSFDQVITGNFPQLSRLACSVLV